MSGVTVHQGAIPRDLVDDALRAINVEIYCHGLSTREIAYWRGEANWFPHLRWHTSVQTIQRHIEAIDVVGEPCEPQILLAFPHDPAWEKPQLEAHIDEPPAWAAGRPYSAIYGVPLTPCNYQTGGLIWRSDNGAWNPVRAEPGDLIHMQPDTPHTGGINQSPHIRAALYFRYLAPTPIPGEDTIVAHGQPLPKGDQ